MQDLLVYKKDSGAEVVSVFTTSSSRTRLSLGLLIQVPACQVNEDNSGPRANLDAQPCSMGSTGRLE